MNTSAPRYKRGDCHPSIAGFVFLRYCTEREVWVTLEKLSKVKEQKKLIDKRFRDKPQNKVAQKAYIREFLRKPEQKARMAQYYRRKDVRCRYRQKYADDPRRLIEAGKREKKKQDRDEYISSPEYKEAIQQYSKDYYRRNKQEFTDKARKRRQEVAEVRIKQNLSRRIRQALRVHKARKSNTTVDLIGCSIPELKSHLEAKFSLGMTWDNYGDKWHIDHHNPCAMFFLEYESQQRICFNWRNLKPMWSADNRAKSDFIQHNGKQVRARELRKIVPFTQAA